MADVQEPAPQAHQDSARRGRRRRRNHGNRGGANNSAAAQPADTPAPHADDAPASIPLNAQPSDSNRGRRGGGRGRGRGRGNGRGRGGMQHSHTAHNIASSQVPGTAEFHQYQANGSAPSNTVPTRGNRNGQSRRRGGGSRQSRNNPRGGMARSWQEQSWYEPLPAYLLTPEYQAQEAAREAAAEQARDEYYEEVLSERLRIQEEARQQQALVELLEAQEAARIASHRSLMSTVMDGNAPIEPSEPMPMSAIERSNQMHIDILKGTYQCVICLDPVLAKTPIWSQCGTCRTAFHFSCVKEWQVTYLRNATQGDRLWKCPSCSSMVTELVKSPSCWCGKENGAPSLPIPGAPPHSCGNQCQRMRSCGHMCTEICHAAHCSPCPNMGYMITCACGKERTMFRCGTKLPTDIRCGGECDKMRACGIHKCTGGCHEDGDCEVCYEIVQTICYCGKKQIPTVCNEIGKKRANVNHGQVSSGELSIPLGGEFHGTFDCGQTCGLKLDCGVHSCEETCHTGECVNRHCPLSPDAIKFCPCGKAELESLPVPPRQLCTDSIPTCGNICDKELVCGHRCPFECHTGPCPTCPLTVTRNCSCGRNELLLACAEASGPVSCERVCKARLNCGRHHCQLQCCTAAKPLEQRSGNRRILTVLDPAHMCSRICGKRMGCGIHDCTEICHSGPCPTCYESTSEDMSCPCGVTVRLAPIPCGYKIRCERSCHRRNPPCGHRYVPHPCHGDDDPCPMCPTLVEKECMCGKTLMRNIQCGRSDVSCGLTCGKALRCGVHFCRKPCHKEGECEDCDSMEAHCDQTCGLSRSCGHPCTLSCHAPDVCPETSACEDRVTLECPCGRLTKSAKCYASIENPTPPREPIECDDECLRLARNKVLAEALKISEKRTDNSVPYGDDTLDIFEKRSAWCSAQEDDIRKFILSREERLRFRPMNAPNRAFIHFLARDYGLESESQDPEPNRAVVVYKRSGYTAFLPAKTLQEASRTRKANNALTVKAQALETASAAPASLAACKNTIALRNLPFAMTLVELDVVLEPTFETHSSVSFTSHFDDKQTAFYRGTHVTGMEPRAFEYLLRRIKTEVERVMRPFGATALLCSADEAFNVTSWEKQVTADGWGMVVSKQKGRAGAWVSSEAGSSQGGSMAAVASATSWGSQRSAPATTLSSKTLVFRKKPAKPKGFMGFASLDLDDNGEGPSNQSRSRSSSEDESAVAVKAPVEQAAGLSPEQSTELLVSELASAVQEENEGGSGSGGGDAGVAVADNVTSEGAATEDDATRDDAVIATNAQKISVEADEAPVIED